jgi:hypothetical protein
MPRQADVEHERDERLMQLGRDWLEDVRRKPPRSTAERRKQETGDGTWLD